MRSTNNADACQAEAKKGRGKTKKGEFVFVFGAFLMLFVSMLVVDIRIWRNASQNGCECTHNRIDEQLATSVSLATGNMETLPRLPVERHILCVRNGKRDLEPM